MKILNKKDCTILSIVIGVFSGAMWLMGFIVGYGIHGGNFFKECFDYVKSKINRD